ncbi:hypothetical protein ACNO65_24435 [Vibrio campbellii]|uniref:hypothetical protein n=1 Tax=Vibrio campbellii TaxID=680 RepID=UPI00193FEF71|nr:hypothetical protein [Vibrio campbellii]MBM4851128.1 hypothetical protein [Vibrio parahaemolyticus]
MIRKIDFWAIGLGTLVDLVMSIIIGFFAQGLAGRTPLPLWNALVLGLICVVLGGYVTAKVAQKYEVYNSVLFGLIGILISLLGINHVPVWYSTLSIVLVVPFAFLGGLIGKKT